MRETVVDLTVTVCAVCAGTTFHRYAGYAEPDDPIATEFADCADCGESYLYKRPARPEDYPTRGQLAFDFEGNLWPASV